MRSLCLAGLIFDWSVKVWLSEIVLVGEFVAGLEFGAGVGVLVVTTGLLELGLGVWAPPETGVWLGVLTSIGAVQAGAEPTPISWRLPLATFEIIEFGQVTGLNR